MGERPFGIAARHDDRFVYVTHGGDTVSVIQTSDNTVIDTIRVGTAPLDIAVRPDDGRFVYVTNLGDDTVSVIATSGN